MIQMKACHKLDKIKDLEIKCMEKELILVTQLQLLGVTIDQQIDQHLEWKSDINKITKERYTTLSS